MNASQLLTDTLFCCFAHVLTAAVYIAYIACRTLELYRQTNYPGIRDFNSLHDRKHETRSLKQGRRNLWTGLEPDFQVYFIM